MVSLGARGRRKLAAVTAGVSFAALGLLTPATARAHFKLEVPASWMSQDSIGGPQKNGPCAATPNTALGDSAGTPTNIVTVEQSGQPVTVTVMATVAHPGWYRIALAEGPSATQTLSTIADPKAQAGTNCTPAIMSNPVWSTTQPVIADGLPAGSTATTQQSGTQTFQVTIPKSASCTSARPCTLQVIMVMTDHPANDCYYHHCADISVGGVDAGTSGQDASVAKDAPLATADAGAGGASGGTSGASGVGGAAGVGGGASSGGVPGKGGSVASGGSETGGSVSSGGNPGSGGTASGGAATKGGSLGAGGLASSGGSTVAAGSGGGGTGSSSTIVAGGASGTSAPGKSGSGCAIVSGGGASAGTFMMAAMLGLLLALRRRRR